MNSFDVFVIKGFTVFFLGIFENPAPTVKQVVSEIKILKKSKISWNIGMSRFKQLINK